MMFWRLLSFYKVKRETCAIRINARYDNSGSSDLKCVVYRSVGLSLSFCYFGWQFCCDSGALSEGG